MVLQVALFLVASFNPFPLPFPKLVILGIFRVHERKKLDNISILFGISLRIFWNPEKDPIFKHNPVKVAQKVIFRIKAN